jgi:4-amino-4-deoxy-L-arabinose transferase
MARYGLHLQLGVDVEKLSLQPLPHQPRFNPEYDESVIDEVGDDFDPHALWITKQERFEAVRAVLDAQGVDAIAQGAPYQGRVLFRVRRQR